MAPSVIRSLEELSSLSGSIGVEGVEVLRRAVGAIYAELHDQVTRDDFVELKKALSELATKQDRLAEAQSASVAAIDRLTTAQAESQVAIDRLAAAQARSEAAIDRLAAVQARSEERLGRTEESLAGFRTESAIRMAESDARMSRVEASLDRVEQAVARLHRSQERLQKEVGGISRNAAFFLEDRAYGALPIILAERLGLEVTGPVVRSWVDVGDERIEVNVWGAANRADGTSVRIVGEAKLQLGRKHLEEFRRRLEKLQPAIRESAVLPLLVTSQAEPEVVRIAEERGWTVVFSHDIEETRHRRLVADIAAVVAVVAPRR